MVSGHWGRGRVEALNPKFEMEEYEEVASALASCVFKSSVFSLRLKLNA